MNNLIQMDLNDYTYFYYNSGKCVIRYFNPLGFYSLNLANLENHIFLLSFFKKPTSCEENLTRLFLNLI